MTYQRRLVISLLIVMAGYVLSTAATVALISQVYGLSCRQVFLTSSCAFGSDQLVGSDTYLALALAIMALLILAHWRWRETVAYPFLMLIGLLCLAAIAIDTVAGRPVIHAPKVINDTINILGAVIASSFILLLVIIRKHDYSLPSLLIAVAISFAIKTISVSAFVALRGAFFGVTELLLLYIVYAFGSFTLHLMTVSTFVTSLTFQPVGARL